MHISTLGAPPPKGQAGGAAALPRRPARDDPRRRHHGVIPDEALAAPIAAGVSYRRAAAALTARYGRTVTKRQVEEAVRRLGGRDALLAPARPAPLPIGLLELQEMIAQTRELARALRDESRRLREEARRLRTLRG
jgi:hypothetical protein